MSAIKLKDKIQITKDFLESTTEKGWLEIEALQNQIENVEIASEEAETFVKLLHGLLTSYYVFVGGLENLVEESITTYKSHQKKTETAEPTKVKNTLIKLQKCSIAQPASTSEDKESSEAFEPFEYFVDFDEPSGKPLSDEDLYGESK